MRHKPDSQVREQEAYHNGNNHVEGRESARGVVYHLALDFGRIRRPVNKYDFVARIAIRCGVPKRQKGKDETGQK